MKKEIFQEIEIPEGIEANIEGNILKINTNYLFPSGGGFGWGLSLSPLKVIFIPQPWNNTTQ